MSYSLDFIGLNEKLFLLRHLIAGTKEYCRRERLFEVPESEDWINYAGRLRHLVSNDLIESAAKFRVIQDSALPQVSSEFRRGLESEYQAGRRIGSVLVGEFQLDLRESCNKIIHATKFDLVFQNARDARLRYLYTYWNGICRFSGKYQSKTWVVALDVYRWAEAMDSYLERLSGEVASIGWEKSCSDAPRRKPRI